MIFFEFNFNMIYYWKKLNLFNFAVIDETDANYLKCSFVYKHWLNIRYQKILLKNKSVVLI